LLFKFTGKNHGVIIVDDSSSILTVKELP